MVGPSRVRHQCDKLEKEATVYLLQWNPVVEGFDAPGYRIRRLEGRFRLEAPGSIAAIRAGAPPRTSWHDSATEAMLSADQSEREELRGVATATHFSLSLIGLAAFVVLSSAIGSLLGLAAVSVSFYVMLRSAANGVGLLLHDAWGWTRLGPQRSSLLERVVGRLASRRRARAMARAVADVAKVRPLDPVS